jgi:hypothetical protein
MGTGVSVVWRAPAVSEAGFVTVPRRCRNALLPPELDDGTSVLPT